MSAGFVETELFEGFGDEFIESEVGKAVLGVRVIDAVDRVEDRPTEQDAPEGIGAFGEEGFEDGLKVRVGAFLGFGEGLEFEERAIAGERVVGEGFGKGKVGLNGAHRVANGEDCVFEAFFRVGLIFEEREQGVGREGVLNGGVERAKRKFENRVAQGGHARVAELSPEFVVGEKGRGLDFLEIEKDVMLIGVEMKAHAVLPEVARGAEILQA